MTVRRRRGFTLIELIVVVSAIAIGLAVAVPAFRRMQRRSTLQGMAQDILVAVRQARVHARTGARDLTGFGPGERVVSAGVEIITAGPGNRIEIFARGDGGSRHVYREEFFPADQMTLSTIVKNAGVVPWVEFSSNGMNTMQNGSQIQIVDSQLQDGLAVDVEYGGRSKIVTDLHNAAASIPPP